MKNRNNNTKNFKRNWTTWHEMKILYLTAQRFMIKKNSFWDTTQWNIDNNTCLKPIYKHNQTSYFVCVVQICDFICCEWFITRFLYFKKLEKDLVNTCSLISAELSFCTNTYVIIRPTSKFHQILLVCLEVCIYSKIF